MQKWKIRLEVAAGVWQVLRFETVDPKMTEEQLADLVWELNGALKYEVTRDA